MTFIATYNNGTDLLRIPIPASSRSEAYDSALQLQDGAWRLCAFRAEAKCRR